MIKIDVALGEIVSTRSIKGGKTLAIKNMYTGKLFKIFVFPEIYQTIQKAQKIGAKEFYITFYSERKSNGDYVKANRLTILCANHVVKLYPMYCVHMEGRGKVMDDYENILKSIDG